MPQPEKKIYRSNGKLLISSEYLVLDGAEALALPTKRGQTLAVSKTETENIIWKSYTVDDDLWFECVFDNNFTPITYSDKNTADVLSTFLRIALSLNPDFLNVARGSMVETHLEFHRSWGLGSSSTLISNIAQWAKVDPFVLQQESFPGSGYDIACALSNKPIVYQIKNKEASYVTLKFHPSFSGEIFFIHLNKKQNSREGINIYREFKGDIETKILLANDFTKDFVECEDTDSFRRLMAKHESLISEIIDQLPVKQKLFPDFKGSVKSLGAWGGDFVMAVGKNTENYFKNKGYNTVIPYDKMVL
ncbi:MAG: GYDIA family GHMP kinase [Bacteroidota bacterium]